jgi:uncharacterized protein YbjQ (UPF0145 family)
VSGAGARPWLGGNAVVSMRYDANEGPGVTELLASGTAVVIEPGR